MKYVVAAMVTGLASIAIPNIRTSMQRSDQKRTMADMRAIATAWEARATDRNSYLVGRPGNVAYADLRRVLEPTYVKRLPQYDGWGRAFVFSTGADGGEYAVRSVGSDGKLDPHTAPGATTDFDCDIIYSNGTFVSYPEASCQEP